MRSVIDSENIQVFISGSSSKLLSKEISTSMRGRTLPYYIYPFSFNEFLKAKNFKVEKYLSSSQKAKLLNLLEKYIKSSLVTFNYNNKNMLVGIIIILFFS